MRWTHIGPFVELSLGLRTRDAVIHANHLQALDVLVELPLPTPTGLATTHGAAASIDGCRTGRKERTDDCSGCRRNSGQVRPSLVARTGWTHDGHCLIMQAWARSPRSAPWVRRRFIYAQDRAGVTTFSHNPLPQKPMGDRSDRKPASVATNDTCVNFRGLRRSVSEVAVLADQCLGGSLWAPLGCFSKTVDSGQEFSFPDRLILSDCILQDLTHLGFEGPTIASRTELQLAYQFIGEKSDTDR